METRPCRVFLLAVLLIATVLSRSLYAESAGLEHLKTSIASLQQVLRDSMLASGERLLQRRKLERTILKQLFDFQEMSRRSLGANARKYEDRLPEFTPLFVDFLEHAYMKILEDNGDAKIRYVKEIGNGENLEVETIARLKDGNEYRVDYKLYMTAVGWRAYDVVVEGISLVNNYRSQFDRVLNKKSFDGLLQDLRDKKTTFN